MEKIIKVIVLVNQQILISQIEEIGADIGEPDCKLINPFKFSIFVILLEKKFNSCKNTWQYLFNSNQLLLESR